MTFQDLVNRYWKYYLTLEKRLLETERYVEFDVPCNGKVYSIEYMMLFQTICSEIDVVGKTYAGICDAAFAADNRTGLNEWWFYVSHSNPALVEKIVSFRNENLQPWHNYRVKQNPRKGKNFVLSEGAETPPWWRAYNGVKHDRVGNGGNNYKDACLQNVLTALSALYSLETTMLEGAFDSDKDQPVPMRFESSLFDEHLKFYTHYVSVDLSY